MRKNLAPSALDHEPSACALDFSRSLPFIAPLRPRWSPVVFQRGMPSISFFFMPLRDSVSHNEGGYTHPPSIRDRVSIHFHVVQSCNSFAFTFLHTLLHGRFSQLLSFQLFPDSLAKTTGVGYPPPPKKREMQITSRRARSR